MGERRADTGDALGRGDRDERAWMALLADLSAGDRELLWTVGVALLHRKRGDQAEPSSPAGTTGP